MPILFRLPLTTFLFGTLSLGSLLANEAMKEKYERLPLFAAEDLVDPSKTSVSALRALMPEIHAAVSYAQQYPYDREDEIAYYDFKVFAESEVSDELRAQNEANKRFARFFSDIFPVIAYAYRIPGDNPYYAKDDIRDLYLKGLQYCYSRGLDENAWFSDHAGRASGKAMEAGLIRQSGDFSSVSLHMGGFAQSLFLMREPLAKAGLLDQYRGVARNIAINNGATFWAFFEHARGEARFDGSEDSGNAYFLNADGIRLFVDYFIPYLLLIEDPTEGASMNRIL